MFLGLVSREVRARYKGSALGFLWSLLNPLMMLAIYSLVFAVYMRIGLPNYAIFLFCGILPWSWFATSIQNATSSITANANLIKKVYFPHEILPLVNVSTNLVNFLLSLPVLLLFMGFTGMSFTVNLLFFPLLVTIQFLFTLGLALLFSTLNAFFRDVEQLLGPLMMAWFYMTPVIYPSSTIPEKFSFILYLNPMAPLIAAYQAIFYYGRTPDFGALFMSLIVACLSFVVGYTAFYRKKFTFAEVV
ncbi:Teichoic acid translocation permease protein TagG [compost metagenome]